MSARYEAELGQLAFGNPTGEYDLTDLGSAALAALLDEMRRVFWNREQREISYQDEGDAEAWNAYGTAIEWHAYWWGGEDDAEAERPNLTFADVAIRWYKYPGRGESVDREMRPDDWAAWLTDALAAARSADSMVA